MTWADYKCDDCSRTDTLEIDADHGCPAYVENVSGDVDRCPGTMVRQWTPVSIGRVPGAGGSPSR